HVHDGAALGEVAVEEALAGELLRAPGEDHVAFGVELVVELVLGFLVAPEHDPAGLEGHVGPLHRHAAGEEEHLLVALLPLEPVGGLDVALPEPVLERLVLRRCGDGGGDEESRDGRGYSISAHVAPRETSTLSGTAMGWTFSISSRTICAARSASPV